MTTSRTPPNPGMISPDAPYEENWTIVQETISIKSLLSVDGIDSSSRPS